MTEKTLKLYKSSIPSCQYIMANGKYLYFKNGRYATDDAKEIEELEAAIASRHPHISVDANESTITAEVFNDPLAEIKKKAIAEYLASQAPKDMGTSDQSAGEGAGMTTSARLVNVGKSNTK